MVTQKQMEELRALFKQKVESDIPGLPQGFHPVDLQRAWSDDEWIKKFIKQCEGDVNNALTTMTDALIWRRQFGTNDLNESNINQEYLKEGLFYPRGKDIDGCTILIFKSKKHVKGQRDSEEIKRCVVYWFEKLDKIEKCDKISIFFDMAETGLSNMDMEFTKYLISLFKQYYPDFLNYILIYEMPWVLSAAFKVIKTLLPAGAVAKMKFITKSSVTDFVPVEEAQASWGGNDNYTYTFVSEPALSGHQTPQTMEKKVTFSDPGSPMQDNKQIITGDGDKNKIGLSPHDCVIFAKDGSDISGTFTITNQFTGYVSYKIKTTSPEKFRVRPNMGILAPGSVQVINLLLLEGYQNSAAGREKFLATCVSIDNQDMSQKELVEMWKDMSKLDVEQHKLRCVYPGKKVNGVVGSNAASSLALGNSDVDGESKDIDQITKLMSALKHNQESLDKNLKTLKTIQLFNLLLTALLLCLIVYLFGLSNKVTSSSTSSGEFCSAP